jgi:hypothetical protein
MKHYGIEMEGKFYSEQLASVPGWTSDDESRLVYDQSGEHLYFGDGTSWVRIASYSEVEVATEFPAGTSMLFSQASAPTGWIRDIAISHSSDKRTIMLADDTEAGALTGGSYDLIGRSLSHVHSTPGHRLTITEMPSHSHSGVLTSNVQSLLDSGNDMWVAANVNSGSTGGGGYHYHGNTGSGGGSLNPRYVTVIIAVKS